MSAIEYKGQGGPAGEKIPTATRGGAIDSILFGFTEEWLDPAPMDPIQHLQKAALLQASIAPIVAANTMPAYLPPFPEAAHQLTAYTMAGSGAPATYPIFSATGATLGTFQPVPCLSPPNAPPVEVKAIPPSPQGMILHFANSPLYSNDIKSSSLVPPASYSELLTTIATSGSRIPLPSYDPHAFDPDFSLKPLLKSFIIGSPLAEMMLLVEYTSRRAVAASPTNPQPNSPVSMVDVARHLLNTLGAINQLPGWKHVELYLRDAQAYHEMMNNNALKPEKPKTPPNPVVDASLTVAISAAKAAEAAGIAQAALATQLAAVGNIPLLSTAVDELQMRGAALLKRLCARIWWVLQLQLRERRIIPEPEIYIRVISADRQWATDANVLMKDAESKVTAMLTNNQKEFQAFRELQRKGVQWPHSPAVRKEIENAGFAFRPMMIKRDRCICETCLVEVFGWSSWHNPWVFHDFAKHPPSFLDRARSHCAHHRIALMLLEEVKARLFSPASSANVLLPAPILPSQRAPQPTPTLSPQQAPTTTANERDKRG